MSEFDLTGNAILSSTDKDPKTLSITRKDTNSKTAGVTTFAEIQMSISGINNDLGVLAFLTNDGISNDERMRIDPTGNVGIGIGARNPNARLEVGGKVRIGDDLENTAGKRLIQGGSATDWLRINPFDSFPRTALYGDVAINTDGAGSAGVVIGAWESGIGKGKLKVHQDSYLAVSGGSVGIGTISPATNAKLDIKGGGLNIGGIGNLDAAIHVKSSYGGFDRLLQMSPTGASKPGLNLLASTNANSDHQWWVWGVDTDNKWKIQPGTSFSGTTGLFIDPSGKVGIGKTDPGYKLDIIGQSRINSNDGLTVQGQGINSYARIWYLTDNTVQWNVGARNDATSAGGFSFENNFAGWASKLFITPAGYIGIGTPGPWAKLEVANLTRNEAGLRIINGARDRSVIIVPQLGGFGYNPLSQEGDSGIFYSDAGGLVIGPWSAAAEGIRIDQNGNVGIGTPGPRYSLDINRNEGTSTILQRIWNTNLAWGAEALVRGYTDYDNTNYPAADWGFYRGTSSDVDSGFIVKTGTVGSTTTRFKIRKDGNVGIGKTDPSDRLYVAADNLQGIRVASEADPNLGIGLIKGTGDGASKDIYNGALESWYGIALRCTLDNKVRIVFNTRNGYITHGGSCTSSSRELKENIENLSDQEAFEALKKLNPVKFDLKKDNQKRKRIGFIAEDVSELVSSSDRRAVINDHIVAILTKVFKEQEKTIEGLIEDVKALQKAIIQQKEKVI